ncbi:MAG: ABC transporter ATP-binding protein [Clostridiales bacterium]|nr:ABC transporter ATP-binding protein [Clostridiales bacterium]
MVRLKNVSAGYNKIEVIKNINISLEEGTITTIIGKNGCGKTTLLKTASNLLEPFRGEILVKGKNIGDMSRKEVAKELSFLPQLRDTPNITVYNLVLHGRFPYLGFPRIPQKKDKLIVESAIESMGLQEYIEKNIWELSGGQRQRAYIAMVLAQDTDIIFLDEPTTYLDINHQFEILEIIKKLKGMGKTIVMVLHDLSSALAYSDRICLMDKGEIVIYDTPQAVYESREINRIFGLSSEQVELKNNAQKQYVFYVS